MAEEEGVAMNMQKNMLTDIKGYLSSSGRSLAILGSICRVIFVSDGNCCANV